MTDWAKVIAAKTSLAQRSLQSGMKPGKISEDARIPAGQTRVYDFPVLDMGLRPAMSLDIWSLRLHGLVEKEITFDWEQFSALPQTTIETDMHCVTRWSQLDLVWQGVLARDVIAMAMPKDDAKFVVMHGHEGYETNLPLEALLDDDVIIAHSVMGKPLEKSHGWPARIIVPKRYAWKGAKWLSALEFRAKDKAGFWEVRGYHNDGDPWKEQRFGVPPEGVE